MSRVTGTGPKSRITKDDVTAVVMGVMTGQRAAPGAAAAAAGARGVSYLNDARAQALSWRAAVDPSLRGG